MHRDRTFRYFLYHGVQVVEWAATIAVALMTLSASQVAQDYTLQPVSSFIIWSQREKLLIFVLAAFAVSAKAARQRIGPPWAWTAIKELLDIWQSQIFASIPSAPADEHRITIFKRVSRWRNPKGWLELKFRTGNPNWWRYREWPVGWFKPLVRSQHVTQRNITWFPCFDAARPGEGFIGAVWRASDTFRTPTLPDLNPPADAVSGLPTEPSAGDYQVYAKQTRVVETWLRERKDKTNARTLCGIKMEKNGKKWGVMVVDSRSASLNLTDSQVKFAAAALGKLIERT
jgi:hypothetical protein